MTVEELGYFVLDEELIGPAFLPIGVSYSHPQKAVTPYALEEFLVEILPEEIIASFDSDFLFSRSIVAFGNIGPFFKKESLFFY